jgi:hypothetical protein
LLLVFTHWILLYKDSKTSFVLLSEEPGKRIQNLELSETLQLIDKFKWITGSPPMLLSM